MYPENELYTTQIIIHPRVIQLQRVLTLDDYLQVQALLEYFQKRQNFIQENQRAQLRLARALNNIRLLKLEYRRQRAAQLQRLLQQYHEQCYEYDRAKLICALEQRRAQLAFRQFLQEQQQKQEEDEENQNNDNKDATQSSEVNNLKTVFTPSSEPLPQIIKTAAQHLLNNDKKEEESLAIQHEETKQDEKINKEEEEEEEDDDDDEYDDEYDDDSYKQYQSQQLKELLKLLFEKYQYQDELKHDDQQVNILPPQFEKKKKEEEVYEPVYRQTGPVSNDYQPFTRQTAPVSGSSDDDQLFARQTGPIGEYDRQTLYDILPILQQQKVQQNEIEKQEPVENKGIETSSFSRNDSDSTFQPQKQNITKENENKNIQSSLPSEKDEEEKPLLPDHITSLEDVLNQLVHTSTPIPPEGEKKKERKKETKVEPIHEEQQQSQEVIEKIKKLNDIGQRIEQLYKQHHDHVVKVPLQYQVTDQGKLFLDGNTPDNRAFLGYEDDIVRCMLQLDSILSDGNQTIRNKRRKIIQRAENILEQLDRHKQQEWEKETRKQNKIQASVQPTRGGKKRRHKKRKNRVPVTA